MMDYGKDLIAAHAEPHVNGRPRYGVAETYAGSPGLLARRYGTLNLIARSRAMRNGKTVPSIRGEWTRGEDGGPWMIAVDGTFVLGSLLDVAVKRGDGQIAHIRGARAVEHGEDPTFQLPITVCEPPPRKTAAQRDAEYEAELDELAWDPEDEWDAWAAERRREAMERGA